MGPILIFGILLVSFWALIQSSDILVEKAEKLALFLGLPSFIIGVTVVSVGTSLPELASSFSAVLHNSPEIIGGNVVGSNIANTFVILGVSLLFLKKEIKMKWDVIYADVTFLAVATFMFWVCTQDGYLSWPEVGLLLITYVVYLLFLKDAERLDVGDDAHFGWMDGLWLMGSFVVLWVSAHYLIDSVVELARLLGVHDSFLGLTLVALGTSLPELSVSVAAARKGNIDLSVANVTGSNLFNILVVSGLPALLNGHIVDDVVHRAIPFLMFSVLLFFLIFLDRRAHKYEGAAAILMYLLFLYHVRP